VKLHVRDCDARESHYCAITRLESRGWFRAGAFLEFHHSRRVNSRARLLLFHANAREFPHSRAEATDNGGSAAIARLILARKSTSSACLRFSRRASLFADATEVPNARYS